MEDTEIPREVQEEGESGEEDHSQDITTHRWTSVQRMSSGGHAWVGMQKTSPNGSVWYQKIKYRREQGFDDEMVHHLCRFTPLISPSVYAPSPLKQDKNRKYFHCLYYLQLFQAV